MRPVPVAGIDVSKDFSDMCILSPDNAVFERVKIYHDKTSMERAVKKLAHAGAVFGQLPIVVMEATGHYHRILYRFLSQHRFSIVTINPLQSSAIKNVSILKIKNDQTDAYRLALAYRTQALKANLVPSDKIENMRLLIRQHFDLKNTYAHKAMRPSHISSGIVFNHSASSRAVRNSISFLSPWASSLASIILSSEVFAIRGFFCQCMQFCCM